VENNWIFKLVFCISFYLVLRFCIIFSWYKPENEKERPNTLAQYIVLLPLISLFGLGFLILKWYLFLLFVLFCFFDPLMQLSPRFYFNKIKPYSAKIVGDYFEIIFFCSYLITTLFYYSYFYVI